MPTTSRWTTVPTAVRSSPTARDRSSCGCPRGGEAPDDTGDMTVLQAPLTKLGCFSTTHATLFHAIGALDKVSLVTTDKDKWHIEQVAQQIEDGTTTYVGKNSAPDYELISAAAPQIILISANTMHGSDEVLAKLDELGIPLHRRQPAPGEPPPWAAWSGSSWWAPCLTWRRRPTPTSTKRCSG